MVENQSEIAPILTAAVARRLLAAIDAGETALAASFDLGLSTEGVAFHDGVAEVRGMALERASLEKIAGDDRKCFEILRGAPRPVAVFSETTGWVRTLVPTADAPATLVAGFPMHRIARTTPLADARAKVKCLGRAPGRVLDTATGLGYTAIELARAGFDVVTVELDPAAIDLARRNPWSAALFRNEGIRLVQGDVAQAVASFADREFAAVLHDPPTLQLAGELYSGAFYRQLRRILKPGGRLFHYVGDPASRAGARTTGGVVRRLAEAGFKDVRRRKSAFGVNAVAARVRTHSVPGVSKRIPPNSNCG